jgi:type IV pilus assembly protein PilB
VKRTLRDLFRRRPVPEDTSIGAILMRQGFITRDQLRQAIELKLKSSGEQLLGEVLVAQGAVTRTQLERILVMQREARGQQVDYMGEASRLAANATASAENLHGSLTNLEDAARRLAARKK